MYLIPELKNDKQNFIVMNTRERRVFQLWLKNIGCILNRRHTSVNTILLQVKSNACHVKHINLHIHISGKPSNLTATTEVDWVPTLLLPTTYTVKNVNTVDMKYATGIVM
jgi:hypothetical protein